MKFQVPQPKKEKPKSNVVTESPYVPGIYVPASKEMVTALEVGQEVTIHITGKVVMLDSRQGDTQPERNEIQLHPLSIEIPELSKNKFSTLAEDDGE